MSKWMGQVCRKNRLKILVLSFSSKLDWGSYIISIAKTAPRKTGALIRSLFFSFLLKLLFISVNLLYGLAWNTFVLFGVVLLTAS